MDAEEIHQLLQRFHDCAPFFIALSDDARQKLILDIADAGKLGMNVTDLSSKSNLSRPAISHHLKVLKDADLIIPNKQGTQIFYKLNLNDKFKELEDFISSMQNVLKKIEEKEIAIN